MASFNEMKSASLNSLKSYTIDKSSIVFTTKQNFLVANLMKNILPAIEVITNFLNNNGLIDCCYSCGSDIGLDLSLINGKSLLICSNCHDSTISSLEENKKNIKAKRGNLFTGLVGALIGSLIGVIVFVIIGQLGYISVVSGIIMAICTLKGYELLSGKISLVGVICSCIIMAFMVWFACSLDYSISIGIELNASPLQIFEVFKMLPYFFEEFEEILHEFTYNLVISYILTVVGAVPTIISMFKQKTGQYSSKRLTFTGNEMNSTLNADEPSVFETPSI